MGGGVEGSLAYRLLGDCKEMAESDVQDRLAGTHPSSVVLPGLRPSHSPGQRTYAEEPATTIIAALGHRGVIEWRTVVPRGLG